MIRPSPEVLLPVAAVPEAELGHLGPVGAEGRVPVRRSLQVHGHELVEVRADNLQISVDI